MFNKIFSLLLLTLVFNSQAEAATISVKDAVIYQLPPTVPNNAAYLTITNASDENKRLLSIDTPVAQAQIHTMMMHNGMMHMKQLPFLDIPANGAVTLEPSGTHIMLLGLNKVLNVGDSVKLVLRFADKTSHEVLANVKSRNDKPDTHHHHHH